MPKTVIANPIRIVKTTITRPDDANAYSQFDVIADSASAPSLLVFPNIVDENGQSGLIRGLAITDTAYNSTTSLILYLFTAPVTQPNDNATWAPTDAEIANLVYSLTVTNFSALNRTSGADGNSIGKYGGGNVYSIAIPFKCAADSRSLWGILQVATSAPLAAFSREQFAIALAVELH